MTGGSSRSVAGGRSAEQLVKYGLVGIASNGIGYAVYLALTYLGAPSKIAMTLLYAVGATIGYLGNRNLTFAYTGGALGSGVRYLIAHAIGYALNLFILLVFVDRFGYPHQLVQAIAIFVVAAILFALFKLFVFTGPPPEAGR